MAAASFLRSQASTSAASRSGAPAWGSGLPVRGGEGDVEEPILADGARGEEEEEDDDLDDDMNPSPAGACTSGSLGS